MMISTWSDAKMFGDICCFISEMKQLILETRVMMVTDLVLQYSMVATECFQDLSSPGPSPVYRFSLPPTM